jgi:hypothetical protein
MSILNQSEVVLQKCQRVSTKAKASKFFCFLTLVSVAGIALKRSNKLDSQVFDKIPELPDINEIFSFSKLEGIEIYLGLIGAFFLLISLLLLWSYASSINKSYLIVTNQRVFINCKESRSQRIKELYIGEITSVSSDKNRIEISKQVDFFAVNKVKNVKQAELVIVHLLKQLHPEFDFEHIHEHDLKNVDDELVAIVDDEIAKEEEEINLIIDEEVQANPLEFL